MSTSAKYAYLIYKITFLQNCIFTTNRCKYTLTNPKLHCMKYLLLLLLIPCFSNSECGKKKKVIPAMEDSTSFRPTDSIPACLRHLIDSSNVKDKSPHILQADAYEFNNQKVYLVKYQCCDFFDELYDENCNRLCAPSGGYSGKGDGKCPDFVKNAKLIKTVWKSQEE